MFATLTQDMPPAWRTLMAWKSVLIATAILLGFAFGGEWVLDKLHVSLDSFRIAGGLLLFLIALDMLFETRSQRRQARNARVIEERRAHPGEHEDISVFPLAIPLIAGPGSIADLREGEVRLAAGFGDRDLRGTQGITRVGHRRGDRLRR